MEKKDEGLFELIKSGNEGGVIKVYDIYRNEFIHWCINNFGIDEDAAADLFQDTVVAFYYNIRNGKIQELTSSLKTYLFAIGKNMALKKLKKESRMIVNTDVLNLNGTSLHEDFFENSDKKRIVAELMSQLGEPCKSILKLFYFDKFSMEAIASSLGYKNEHVVKSQKLRCFNNLKKMTLERFKKEDL